MANPAFFSKEDFTIYKEKMNNDILSVVIPIDINPATAAIIIHELDILYGPLRIDLAELEGTKTRYEKLISRLEKTHNEGSNAENRKKNATIYISEYPDANNSENKINLYEVYSTIYEKYLIVKGFVDVVANKQNKMITMLGVMKLDTALGNNY